MTMTLLKVACGGMSAHEQISGAFPPISYMYAFSLDSRQGVASTTPEEALAFIKDFLSKTKATTILITDIAKHGMHRYITAHLPKQFNATSKNGKVTVSVARSPVYRNYNSGSDVQEVRLTLVKGWAKE